MISVTLQFPDALAASHALARLAAPEEFAAAATTIDYVRSAEAGTPVVIAHADRPDVGAPPMPPLSTTPTPLAEIHAAAAFGGAVAQAAPLISGSANLNPMVAALNAPPHVPVAPPTPPGPASIPPSAATGQTAAPTEPERDSTGLVWDARIHASTKTKTKEGVWTAKRNVPDDFRAQVVADLRGVPAPQAAAAAPAAPPVPQAPVAPVAPPAAPQARTFAQYMADVGGVFSARPVDAHNFMTQALAPHGLQHIGQLAGRPDLIDAVDAEFRRLLG